MQYLIAALGIIIAVAAFAVMVPIVLGFILCIFGIIFLYWAIGTKVTIRSGGKVVGYLRWFKFYRSL